MQSSDVADYKQAQDQWNSWWDSLTEQQRIDAFFMISDRILTTIDSIEVIEDVANPDQKEYKKVLYKAQNEKVSFSFVDDNKTLRVLVADHDIIYDVVTV
jgi:hypothetical protein